MRPPTRRLIRGPGRWARGGLLAGVAAISAATLMAASAPAASGVFSLDRLRLGGPGGTETYVYTTGNVVFPEGGVDLGRFYRVVVTDSAGVTHNSPVCRPESQFATADNTYTVGANDQLSGSAAWKFTLNQYTTSACSGTPSKTANKSFYVAQATAYADSALTIPRGTFRPGETAYVVARGVKTSSNNWSSTWLLPSGAVACANTANSDRPDSSTGGVLPGTSGTFLQYRPNTTNAGSTWNRESNYETRPCVSFAAANEGPWKLRLQFNATNVVDLPVFAVDATAPPAPTIDSRPPNPSGAANASFTFADADSGATFLCRLDGASLAACTSPAAYSGLTDDAHTFQVKARDVVGNESAATSYTWTVDTTAPPAPSINPRPPDPSNSPNATFGFAGEAGATFTCRIDGSAFGDCESPVGYLNLTEGQHSFAVRAQDGVGNQGPATSYAWTIDLTPPGVPSIDSHPPSPTDSSTATFAFSGEAGASLSCRLDQGAFAACTSPRTYSGLADGTHAFEVKARDAAGNESAAASYGWLISAPPVVTLTQPANGSSTNDATPTFSGVGGTEVGDDPHVTVKVFQGSSVDGPLVETLVTQVDFTGAYSIEAAPALPDGTYTARAEQSDAVGTGVSSANTFAVDASPPAVPSIDSHPPALSNTRSATFTFSGEAGASFRCRLDGVAFAQCTSPVNYSGLADGPHSFDVTARDSAGNESTPASFGWTIDATAPAITLTSPANGSSSDNPRPTFAGVGGTASGDAPTAVVRVYSGADVGGQLVQTLTATVGSGGAYSVVASTDLAEGTYTARAEQQDAAGNLGLSSANTFVVGTSYRSEVLADNPGSYWRLGEASGTAAADTMGANPGTYTGGVTLGQPGAIVGDTNASASLDGVDDYVVVPDAPSLDFTTAVTVEAWVQRTKSAAYQVVLGKPGNGQSKLENYSLWFNTGNGIQAYFGNGTTFVSVASAALDTSWHHVVATYDNATAKLYVDGTLRSSASSTVQLTPNTLPLNLGRAQGTSSYSFGGRLDEVAVYPSILSAARIQAHYDAARRTDSRAPTVTLASPANGSALRTATPTLAGVAGSEVGDSSTVTVKVYSGPTPTGAPVRTMTATRQPDSTYSVNVSPALPDGTYTAQAEQTDESGNLGRSSSNTFSVDTVAPAPTLVNPAHGSVKNPPPTFSGQGGTAAGDASSVTVKVYAGADTSGQLVRTLTAPLVGGSYSVDASPPLDLGTYTAQVQQLDLAGNVGLSSANTFTITDQDMTPPLVTLTQPANGTRTSETTPLFGGTGGTALGDSSTVTVKIYSGPTPTGAPVQTRSTTRDTFGAYSVRAAALPEGTYTAQAEQSDLGDNLGQSAPVTLAIDTTGPAIVLTSPANGSSSGNPTPSFAGTAGTAPGDNAAVTVKVWSGPTPTGTPIQALSTTAGTGGVYSVLASQALQQGTYTARAEQSDSAGNGGQSSANTFTITPSSSATVLAAGDISSPSCSSDAGAWTTAALLDQNPNSTVIPLGDTAYDHGQPSDFACYDRTWGRAKARTKPMIGDHEYDVVPGGTAPGVGFMQYFQGQLAPYGPAAVDPSKGYYSYDLGAWHVVTLNSSCYFQVAPNCDTEAQEQWFENDLNAHPRDCTLVTWHATRWSSGSIHGDYYPTQQFWETAYDHGVELVLSGNDHEYERFARQDAAGNADPQYGVRQFVVGTGGYSHYDFGTIQPNSQVRNSDTYGVLKLTLRQSDFDWQFLPEAGHSFTDSGSDQCHTAPPPPAPGSPVVRSSSSASANHPSASISIAKPAGTAQGDLLLAIISHQSGAAASMTPPAGWTAVPNSDYSDGNNARIHAWYKFAGASEPSSYTFTMTGSSQAIAGGMLAVTGASATPINASFGQVTGTNTLFLTAPSITTTASKTLLVYGGAINQPLFITPPAFMRERFDVGTTGTYNVRTEVATQALATAGATGVRTAYVSNSGARGAAIAIAIASSSP
jgi:Concanavalin A-like lectin/glucanases superfamily/Bacterial Ig-like domain